MREECQLTSLTPLSGWEAGSSPPSAVPTPAEQHKAASETMALRGPSDLRTSVVVTHAESQVSDRKTPGVTCDTYVTASVLLEKKGTTNRGCVLFLFYKKKEG